MLSGDLVFSRQHRKTRPLFVLADILLIWLAFEAAYATRSQLPLFHEFYILEPTKTLLISASVLAWALVGVWLGVYDLILRGRRRIVVWNAMRQSAAGALLLVLFQYSQRVDLSRPFIGFLWLYASAFLIAFRLTARALAPAVLGAQAARRFLLIAGTGESAVRTARVLVGSERFGLVLLGFLDQKPGELELQRAYPVYAYTQLPALLREKVIDEIIFAVDTANLAGLEETFLLCDEEGVRTRIQVDFFPHVHSRVDLERLEGEPMLTFSAAPHDETRLMLKRAIDVLLALVSLIVLSPFLLLIALLIRLTSPGPALFKQQRCGLNGRRFVLWKFRTMTADAEQRQEEVRHMNVKRTAFKIPNDPRLTSVGRWLRKFSLDELPQLWNVLRGEMSLVGPRPAVPEEVEQYERWQRRRLRMRPGLTCLWALAGRDTLDFDEWMRLDLAYIDAWSLWLDWSIMLRTVPHVLLGRGAN
jgi:exopolysaccharide biosynthesis polyprenyl glycosylphosphotransferase